MRKDKAAGPRPVRLTSLRSIAIAAAIGIMVPLLQGTVSAASARTPSPSAVLTAGRNVFVQNCASCHGPQAQGGLSFGSVRAANIRGSHLRALHTPYTQARLQRAIADGIDQNGKPLNAAMPRWKGILSDTEPQQVATYLWSLRAEPVASTTHTVHSVATIPLLEGIVMLAFIAGGAVITKRWQY